MRKDFLVFGSPRIEEDDITEVVDSLRSGWISTGPKVARFEALFRDYTGSRHALALNSCTAGLHLSMVVAGLKAGDEIITTPMTFGATANAIIHSGATPVFADISLPGMNIDPETIEEKISPRTRAIVPVHFAGRPCPMDEINDIARRHNLIVIEDAAHALESVYRGRKIGTIGDLTVFSFYVTKNLVTGEGGMITTADDRYAEMIQTYGLHGMSKGAWKRYSDEGFKHYQIIFPGFKYNMMDIQAALGIHQMRKVGDYLKRREAIWQRYDDAFKHLPLDTPAPAAADTVHARHLYTILLRLEELTASRDTIQQALYEENIGTGIHFISLHLQPYYAERFGFSPGDYPNAAYVSDRTISLPLSAKLTDRDVDDVIDAVGRVLTTYKK
jgi:dTDP-4-amino-4,6-dideoxygalactose transaminase